MMLNNVKQRASRVAQPFLESSIERGFHPESLRQELCVWRYGVPSLYWYLIHLESIHRFVGSEILMRSVRMTREMLKHLSVGHSQSMCLQETQHR